MNSHVLFTSIKEKFQLKFKKKFCQMNVLAILGFQKVPEKSINNKDFNSSGQFIDVGLRLRDRSRGNLSVRVRTVRTKK